MQTVKRNIDQILRRDEPHRRKERTHAKNEQETAVILYHLGDVYKRQVYLNIRLRKYGMIHTDLLTKKCRKLLARMKQKMCRRDRYVLDQDGKDL